MVEEFVKMTIKTLLIDPITKMPIVVLHQDSQQEKVLPIWVGIFEANAIAVKMENVESPRPMTHDLLRNIFQTLSCSVKRIEINNLKNNTYYANIIIEKAGEELAIDSRPSDAIALALRTESPIFVAQSVLQKAYEHSASEEGEGGRENELKKWFESLSPENLHKYKM
jgi:hypothetical protein